jgi:hypothetical protein
MDANSDIHLSTIDRPSVRAMVATESAYKRQAMEAGENIHQTALDRLDKLNEYMATLSAEDLEKFITLYEQEMTAVTKALDDEVLALNAQTLNQHVQTSAGASQVATWVMIVSFFIFLIVTISMFK